MNLEDKKSLLGLKIKNFRKQKGYTQEALAEALMVDISGLSKIENGKSFPSFDTLCKIMEILKIEPNKMFDFLNLNKSQSLKDEIVIEKIRQLSHEDKQKVLKIIEIIKK